jgi:hypothetical protein
MSIRSPASSAVAISCCRDINLLLLKLAEQRGPAQPAPLTQTARPVARCAACKSTRAEHWLVVHTVVSLCAADSAAWVRGALPTPRRFEYGRYCARHAVHLAGARGSRTATSMSASVRLVGLSPSRGTP